MTHFIKHLSFGKDYPGIVNPLDGTVVTAEQGTGLKFQVHFSVCVKVYTTANFRFSWEGNKFQNAWISLFSSQNASEQEGSGYEQPLVLHGSGK